jgi:hypothetical protein
MKCHISSNSISRIEPEISGSRNLAASCRIHFKTAGGVTPNSLAMNPYEPLPTEYNMTAKARFTAASGSTLPSPATKL